MLNNIYLFVGKSGSGKSSIVHELCKLNDYTEVQSYTERPKRSEDEIGHIFVTKEAFDKLENLCAYTVFNGNRYGVTQDVIDNSDLYVIDPAGIEYMLSHYNGKKKIIVIGVICSDSANEDLEIRRSRMLSRGDSILEVESRLIHDEKVFVDMDKYLQYTIINKDIGESVQKVQWIITQEEMKNGIHSWDDSLQKI